MEDGPGEKKKKHVSLSIAFELRRICLIYLPLDQDLIPYPVIQKVSMVSII
jgi:hypothetical protein